MKCKNRKAALWSWSANVHALHKEASSWQHPWNGTLVRSCSTLQTHCLHTQIFPNTLLNIYFEKSHLTFFPVINYQIQDFFPKEDLQWRQILKIKMPTLTTKTRRSKSTSTITNLSFACISLAYKRSNAPKGRISKCAKSCRSLYIQLEVRDLRNIIMIFMYFVRSSVGPTGLNFHSGLCHIYIEAKNHGTMQVGRFFWKSSHPSPCSKQRHYWS